MPETFRLPNKNKGQAPRLLIATADRAFCQDDVALP